MYLSFLRWQEKEQVASFHLAPVRAPGRAWLPRRRWRAASECPVGFLWLGMPPPSAVRATCLVQRGIMSQHNLPPVEKRHVLPRGEKESILLSSINLELALFFLPFTISVCPQPFPPVTSFISDHCIQPAIPIK